MLKHYPKQTFPLVGARFVERAGYHGVRAIIVYFASVHVGLSQLETFQWYGYITFTTYAFFFIGGLLSDFLLKPKLSILIGGSMQVLGILLFTLANPLTFKIGAILFAAGSGIYSVTLIASLGRLYFNKEKSINSMFSLYYAAVMIAILIGTLLFGVLSSKSAFIITFLLIALSFIAATTLAYKNVTNVIPHYSKSSNSPKTSSLFINLFVIILTALFLISIEFNSNLILQFRLSEPLLSSQIVRISHIHNISNYIIVVCAVLAFIVSCFVRLGNFLKLAIGSLLVSIGLIITISAIDSTDGFTTILTVNLFLFAIVDVLIFPAGYAIHSMHSNPKYLTIIMGSSFLLVFILIHVTMPFFIEKFEDFSDKLFSLKILAILFLIMATIAVLFHRFVKQRPFIPADNTPEAEDLIDYKSGEILD